MKKLKILFSLFLIVLLALLICSCDKTKGDPEDTEDTAVYEQNISLTTENYKEYLTVKGTVSGAQMNPILFGSYNKTPTGEIVYKGSRPFIDVTVSPINEEHVFDKTTITLDVVYYFKSWDMYNPWMEVDDQQYQTVTIDLDRSGHGKTTISLTEVGDPEQYLLGVSKPFTKSLEGTCKIPCIHEYSDGEITVSPTCQQKGTMTTVCTKCSKTQETELDIIDHEKGETPISTQKLTCTQDGITIYQCKYCEKNIEEKISATGHNYTTASFDATCLDNAYEIRSCTKCSHKETIVEEGSALGHDEIPHEALPATCLEEGWVEYVTCSRCEYTTFPQAKRDALGHKFLKEIMWLPSCTNTGKIRTYCKYCDIYSDEIIPIRHNFTTQVGKAPTCTEQGWDDYELCSKCGYSTQTIREPLDHNIVIDRAVSASCYEDGLTEGSHCDRCQTVIVEQVPVKAGHSYGSWHTVKEPTASKEGVQSRSCSRCGETQTLSIPKKSTVNLSIDLSVPSSLKEYFNTSPSVSYEVKENGSTYDVTVKVSWNLKEHHFLRVKASIDGAESYNTTYDGWAGSGSKTFKFTGLRAGTAKLKVSVGYI